MHRGRFDDGYGDIFLIVDGWGTLRSDFPDAEDRIRLMAERALSFGVHFIATHCARWTSVSDAGYFRFAS